MSGRKRYLVTGGTGFIGAAVVKSLLKSGHAVRILDNNFRGRERRIEDVSNDVEMIEGDIRNPAVVSSAAAGVDSIIHLAFINGTEFFYQRPELVLEVGVKGMMNVLDAAIAHHIPELVLASSSEVYQVPAHVPTDESVALSVPDPLNPRYSYGGGKIISELLAINYGRKFFERVVIFRPHNVYGPDMGREHVVPQFSMKLAALARTTTGVIPFPIQGSGQETRSFIYIDDFADGFACLLTKGEHLGIYHIGTMEEVTIASLATSVASCIGRTIELKTSPVLEGSTPRRCPNIARLKALGFSPRIPLAEGLGRTVPWYAEYGESKI